MGLGGGTGAADVVSADVVDGAAVGAAAVAGHRVGGLVITEGDGGGGAGDDCAGLDRVWIGRGGGLIGVKV